MTDGAGGSDTVRKEAAKEGAGVALPTGQGRKALIAAGSALLALAEVGILVVTAVIFEHARPFATSSSPPNYIILSVQWLEDLIAFLEMIYVIINFIFIALILIKKIEGPLRDFLDFAQEIFISIIFMSIMLFFVYSIGILYNPSILNIDHVQNNIYYFGICVLFYISCFEYAVFTLIALFNSVMSKWRKFRQ